MVNGKPPIRILQVVGGGMGQAGTETWLMQVLRQIKRERFHLDFLVHTNEPCAYDEEIRALGSTIIPASNYHRLLSYAASFRRILREHGPYNIVHSHTHHFSGFILRLASREGVPVRIAHSHSDRTIVESGAGWLRRSYLALTKRWVQKYATAGLAVSHQAATDLFGPDWTADSRWRVFHCGIDLTPFEANGPDRQAVRKELGLPPDALVIGHVGRFIPSKNHKVFLKISAEVAKHEPNLWLLFIGDGPMRGSIQKQAQEMGLGDRCLFLGERTDVPQLMRGAIDVFLFPSQYEGLGLALVEAQAAGLPCLCSDVIPTEAYLVKEQVHRLSLTQPPSVWAEAVLAASSNSFEQHKALAIVKQSPFNLKSGIVELEALYSDLLL